VHSWGCAASLGGLVDRLLLLVHQLAHRRAEVALLAQIASHLVSLRGCHLQMLIHRRLHLLDRLLLRCHLMGVLRREMLLHRVVLATIRTLRLARLLEVFIEHL